MKKTILALALITPLAAMATGNHHDGKQRWNVGASVGSDISAIGGSFASNGSAYNATSGYASGKSWSRLDGACGCDPAIRTGGSFSFGAESFSDAWGAAEAGGDWQVNGGFSAGGDARSWSRW